MYKKESLTQLGTSKKLHAKVIMIISSSYAHEYSNISVKDSITMSMSRVIEPPNARHLMV